MAQIAFQNVSYRRGGKEIVKNLSAEFAPGDFVSIVGPSGSGKSTFLRLCCHLISPTGGKILFHGKDMLRENPIEIRKKIRYCFQEPVLWGNTVEDNVAFPYRIRNRKADREKIVSLLSRFHMDESCLTHDVKSLSGGEKQRIALVRTLLFEPEVLLLDEATSALDADNAELVEKEIYRLNQKGVTVLWVTHNDAQSRKYANRLLTIENGQIQSREELK
ncbi:MAG: ATP-binding cassette domain-containing protein [Oscillospiraceae bacterium]|nr:ATP-binding cassette domain-containing protein [Oscillospiraceae bacterium]MCI1990708.1 ATP-binding cassette domain-containing protein [Oscillospiraceae bacterium]MCI2035458.1 ATP-binding cassette domain-containing protein [Oscillospiraceae bacterium]